MQIRWLDDALADVTEIHGYIAADNPRAAARVVERIQTAVRLLRGLPHRGRPGRWRGTRELVIPGTPYIAPYLVRGDLVEILRVFHGARRRPIDPAD
jgi:addiction module RelE/StbE family toxin